MLVNINRVRQMASVLESMGVAIDDKEMAMAVLNVGSYRSKVGERVRPFW